MKITQAQLKKIWATARELGIEEEVLRERVEQVSGSRSLSSLSSEDANRIIDGLECYTGRTRTNRASKGQLYKIRQLEKQLGWDANPKRLQAFIKKYAHVERIDWLTSAQAWRLIESLKNVLEKEK